MTTHREVTATERTHASLLPVFLIVLVDVFGLTLVLPLLAIYAESFHATALQCSREHRSARPVIAISGQAGGRRSMKPEVASPQGPHGRPDRRGWRLI